MLHQVQTWCVTVFYQQIENGNIANQIHGFTIDYGKFILKLDRNTVHVFYFLNIVDHFTFVARPTWFASLSYTLTTQYLLTLQLRLRWLQTMSCSCETNSNKSHQRRRFSANHFQSLLGSRDISRAFHASRLMDHTFWLVYGYFYVLQFLTFWQSDSSITSNKEQPRVIFLRLNCST